MGYEFILFPDNYSLVESTGNGEIIPVRQQHITYQDNDSALGVPEGLKKALNTTSVTGKLSGRVMGYLLPILVAARRTPELTYKVDGVLDMLIEWAEIYPYGALKVLC